MKRARSDNELHRRTTTWRLAAASLMTAIFLLDTFSTLEGAVAVLYVVAVLLVARTHERNDIVITATAGVVLTIVAYAVGHGLEDAGAQTVRAFVSLCAVCIAALLALQNQGSMHALVQSERRYRRMFDATRIGVIEQDWTELTKALHILGVAERETLQSHLAERPEFLKHARTLIRIKDVNPAFAAMHSSDATSALPETVDDVLVETDRTFSGALLAFARGDSFYEGETELVRANGQRMPVLFAITFAPREDHDASVFVFVIDSTERKRHQDALLLAQTELAHAARVATLGELTASIAHEVNQPLMAVVTDGQAAMRWLNRAPPNLDEVEAALTRITSEGRRAADIVHRIRAFLAKTATPPQEFDAAIVVQDAVRLMEHELARGLVELSVGIESRLPAIRGDRVQLQQVLINLMVNASQAMRTQTGRRLLAVRAGRVGDDGIQIVISDTGAGIAPEHLDRLFDPFFTTKPQGMGMGLAICRTIVDAHRGRLSVNSAPGRGAAFSLFLPTMVPP